MSIPTWELLFDNFRYLPSPNRHPKNTQGIPNKSKPVYPSDMTNPDKLSVSRHIPILITQPSVGRRTLPVLILTCPFPETVSKILSRVGWGDEPTVNRSTDELYLRLL